jgi:hypothetical protein
MLFKRESRQQKEKSNPKTLMKWMFLLDKLTQGSDMGMSILATVLD